MYQVETPKGIRCQICPNECTLGEGEMSDCHNRKVYDGKLYTIAYGNHPEVNYNLESLVGEPVSLGPVRVKPFQLIKKRGVASKK